MAVKLAHNGIPQFFDSNGDPLSGGFLFTYTAGSSTKQATYQDDAGATPHANPIVLNSRGEPPAPIWLTAGVSYKFVLAPSTDSDPPAAPIWTADDISGINDTSVSIDQWVSGPAPTFVSTTSFTLVGDQTSTFHVGRRLKSTNSGGTIYSTITASAFGAVTTITVANDSGALDSGLSAVSYGLLSADNPSTPLLTDAYPIASGSADKTKKLRLELDGLTTATTRVQTPPDYDHRVMSQTHGADIASATGAGTLNLDTATGDLVDVTGTTAITAVTLAEGKMAMVRFTGALTLTHGASLVLPGAANITTAAGDFAIFRGYAAGVVRCSHYQPVSGFGVFPQGLTKLNSGSVSGATLDIVMTGNAPTGPAYSAFAHKLLVGDFIPATDAVTLLARVSTNGGSSYDAAASDYSDVLTVIDDSTATVTVQRNAPGGGATSASLSLAANVGNGATEGISTRVFIPHSTSAARWPKIEVQSSWVSADATPRAVSAQGVCVRRAAQDTDAIRLLFSSGNIVGTWALYGWN